MGKARKGDGGDGSDGSDDGDGETGVNCVNKNEGCQEWANRGECDHNSRNMIPNCPKACGFCENSENQNKRCEKWADKGRVRRRYLVYVAKL